jgi:hypothetical protein
VLFGFSRMNRFALSEEWFARLKNLGKIKENDWAFVQLLVVILSVCEQVLSLQKPRNLTFCQHYATPGKRVRKMNFVPCNLTRG